MTSHSVLNAFLVLALVVGIAGRGTSAVGAISDHTAPGHPVLAAERTPEEAIAEVQNLGGTFTRDENSPSKPVIAVILRGTQVTDARLEHLKGLAQLRTLYLSATKVTDAGLEHLEGFSQLQSLTLTYNQLTDAGLKHLNGLTQLRTLNLRGTQVTEAGVKKLQQALPNCRIRWTQPLAGGGVAAAPAGVRGGWGARGGVPGAAVTPLARNDAVAEIQKLGGKFVAFGQRSSWSPDGQQIVFGRNGNGILIHDVATHKTTLLTPLGKDPAWSGKDGRWIAYMTGSGTAEAVFVAEVPGGRPFRVASGSMPSWSADGKTLFFQSFERKQLMSTEVTGNGQFTPPRARIAMSYRYPAVSPDGKRVAYKDGDDLVIQQIDDGKVLKRFELPRIDGILGGWAPDSRTFGFGGWNAGDALPYIIVDVETCLAHFAASCPLTLPAWSPDGAKMSFDIRLRTGAEIRMIDAEVMKKLPAFMMQARPTEVVMAVNGAGGHNLAVEGKWKLPPGSPAPAIAPFDKNKAQEHQKSWARHLGIPVEITNSIGMKLKLIPPGQFEMGSPKEMIDEELKTSWGSYREFVASEGPKHQVRITKPFYMGTYAVTQEEYERVMGSNPSNFSAHGNRKDAVGGLDTKRFPVEQVSWDQAVEFCRKLSDLPAEKAANRRYRLPTEAQWEYACRAGNAGRWYFSAQTNPFPVAVEEKLLGEHAWLNTNSAGRPHPVGEKRSNAWGLYDMYGNVWERCQDYYDKDYYAKSAVDDPAGPAQGSQRVCRGGSWLRDAAFARSACRSCDPPETRIDHLGFRISSY